MIDLDFFVVLGRLVLVPNRNIGGHTSNGELSGEISWLEKPPVANVFSFGKVGFVSEKKSCLEAADLLEFGLGERVQSYILISCMTSTPVI